MLPIMIYRILLAPSIVRFDELLEGSHIIVSAIRYFLLGFTGGFVDKLILKSTNL